MSKDDPKVPGPTKCRRCNDPIGAEPSVRRGGAIYHDRPDCLSRKARPHRHRVCPCVVCGDTCPRCGEGRLQKEAKQAPTAA